MKARTILLTTLGAMAVLAACPSGAFANFLLVGDATTLGNSGQANWVQYTFGTRFTIGADPLSVTKLGYIDQMNVVGGSHGDGLQDAHRVGIFDLSGTELTSAEAPVVAAGTAAPLDGLNWRWVTLATPIALAANTTYVMAGDTGTTGEVYRYGWLSSSAQWGAGLTPSPRVQTGVGVGWAYPSTGLTPNEVWVSANMEYDVIPEPATMCLLGIGGLGLLLRKRRRA